METKTFLFTTSFYPPYHIGGDAIHVAYLSRELVARGHEVHVLHSVDAYRLKVKEKRAPTEKNDGVNVHSCKSPFGRLSPLSAYAMGRSPYISKKFDALVKGISPDVVHHHNISLLGVDLLRKRDSYLNLYTAHDYWLICPRNDMMYKGGQICNTKSCLSCTLASRRLLQRWRRPDRLQSVVAEVDRIIAPSGALLSLIAKEFQNAMSLIYNFAPEPPTEISDIDFDDFFLYAGVLEEHKGVRLMVDAFAESEVDSKLVIVGRGKLMDYLIRKSRTSDLKERIVVLGRVSRDHLYGLYARTLALILPSIWLENCPLVVLEALSVGAPVLAADIGGLGEVVRLSKGGIVFDPEPNRVKECIEIMASDEDSRRTLSMNARESYLKWFSPSAFIRSYENEIDETTVN